MSNHYVYLYSIGTRIIVFKALQRGGQNEHSAGRCFQPVFGNIQPRRCQEVGSYGDHMECKSEGSKSISGTMKQ